MDPELDLKWIPGRVEPWRVGVTRAYGLFLANDGKPVASPDRGMRASLGRSFTSNDQRTLPPPPSPCVSGPGRWAGALRSARGL
jgi:hypothetical protein